MKTNQQPAKSTAFDLETFLPYRLSVLSNTISEGIARSYQEYGLSVPEWRVMTTLGRYPGLTAREVGERTVMDKVTVSRAVNSLLDKQLIQRVIDQEDRRKLPLQLSPDAGTSVLNKIIPKALAYEKALLQDLQNNRKLQLNQLVELLQAKADALGAEPTTDKP